MRFLGSKFTQNALADGAPPLTPLGELQRSPDSLADFRGPLRGRGKGREVKEGGGGEGKTERYWGRERGMEWTGRWEGGRIGRGGEFASLTLGDRRPCQNVLKFVVIWLCYGRRQWALIIETRCT